ncbi:MAG: hypothetical protein COV10_01010 [Candidatus Vogelbacteria bacterium CG10_big_fil_rev_8_21_14_0_10_51_16]|uniref:t-SNARE coiled-coil homology domain-containing protein n=1 Tax=Candidatus Vogelbacteria bacterium CG10_big_fil_rev_8_21_14_0_10_51_16 TaxID=1975045 RepID=A0A2H0RF82_9BACT|nr:MAG: hypothetical protein COV10_01010 [Candidatus Vogelbacteria bacterium CG10_big_fil_rev_8_21_14_0_10_51_16]
MIKTLPKTKKYAKGRQVDIQDVFEAVGKLAQDVDKRFDAAGEELVKSVGKLAQDVDKRFDAMEGDLLEAVGKLAQNVEGRFDSVDKRFDGLEDRVGGLEEDVSYLKRNMVTKVYLDERIGDVRGDITELVHRADRKFTELVHTLEDKDVLSEGDAVRILGMPPFPLGQHTP